MENEQTLKKQRHGCVTSLLIFMMMANSASVILYLFATEFISKTLSIQISDSDKIFLSLFQIANFISCILLFQWKKIGFWLYIATNVATVVLSIYQGKGISQLWSALFGVAFLYGVMQIATKNRKTTWEELI